MSLKYQLALLAGVYSMLMSALLEAETLTIVVTDIANDKGSIMIQVMNSPAQFTGEEASVMSLIRRAQAGEIVFTTTALPVGDYAVRILHDVNGNGEMDSNFVGMPKEPWAMSNNAKGNFGPPSWEDARFALSGQTTQTLALTK